MFDVESAFEFIKQKEGRIFPRKYVLSLLKKRDISSLSIPKDLGDDKELWFIYKLLYAPNTLTDEDLHVRGGLDLKGCTSLQSLPQGLSVGKNLSLKGCTSLQSLPEGLSVGWWLDLEGCISLQSLPEGLSVGWSLFFKKSDPIPQRFGGDEGAIRRYIGVELGGEVERGIRIEE